MLARICSRSPLIKLIFLFYLMLLFLFKSAASFLISYYTLLILILYYYEYRCFKITYQDIYLIINCLF